MVWKRSIVHGLSNLIKEEVFFRFVDPWIMTVSHLALQHGWWFRHTVRKVSPPYSSSRIGSGGADLATGSFIKCQMFSFHFRGRLPIPSLQIPKNFLKTFRAAWVSYSSESKTKGYSYSWSAIITKYSSIESSPSPLDNQKLNHEVH